MSITIAERPLSREFNNSSAKRVYLVVTSDGEDESEVKTAVLAEVPDTYCDLPLTDVRAEEINFGMDGGAEEMLPNTWDVEVVYGTRGGSLAPRPTGSIVWSGSTAGGRERITHGIAFRAGSAIPGAGVYKWEGKSFTAWRNADWKFPTNWGAIGATRDGVAGIEIVVPVDSFQAVKYVDAASWPALKAACDELTGRTNDDAWTADAISYAAGEVLFMGLAGWAKRTEVEPNDYEVTFLFAAGKKITGYKVGDVPPEGDLIEKDPWDYLDITFENHQSTGETVLVQRPMAVTVHRVYRQGDFGDLGLDP